MTAQHQQAWAAYRTVRLVLDARVARDLEAGTGLSMPDFDVLAAVRALADPPAPGSWLVPLSPTGPRPGARTAHCVRVAALADRMGWSRSRLSRQLGRMERRSHVARVPCELDGRGDDVELTDAGRRALDGAEPVVIASVQTHFTGALTDAQLGALTEICDALTRGPEERGAEER
jgi:DNA-binding MarR family transcriptional regulator